MLNITLLLEITPLYTCPSSNFSSSLSDSDRQELSSSPGKSYLYILTVIIIVTATAVEALPVAILASAVREAFSIATRVGLPFSPRSEKELLPSDLAGSNQGFSTHGDFPR